MSKLEEKVARLEAERDHLIQRMVHFIYQEYSRQLAPVLIDEMKVSTLKTGDDAVADWKEANR